MVRAVDRRFTFWMAGYYDDFMNAKAIPDDSNTMGTTWKSLETHAGNPLNGLAPYNPRYKYAWCVRGTGTGGANFNGFTAFSATVQADRNLHNNGMNEWLTFDPEWYNQGGYWGTTHIQYPDSKTNSNRQKFDGGTGIIGDAYLGTDPVEGYLMFSNSYNTQGKYYAFNGRTDSSYGRDTMDWSGLLSGTRPEVAAGKLDASAGEPDNQAAADIDYRIDTHLAGVYTGEIPIEDKMITGNNNAGAIAFGTMLHSPSKTNFLVQEIYAEQTHASSGYFPTLVYQNSLNCKGDMDTIVFRACVFSNDAGNSKLKMSFGYSDPTIPIVSTATGDTAGTTSNFAINYELDVSTYSTGLDLSSQATPALIDTIVNTLWIDYELQLNFTSQNYRVLKNGAIIGGATAFNTHPDGGRDWTPADFYGWQAEAKRAEKKMTFLLDRIGVVRHLNEILIGGDDIAPVASSIRYSSTVNSTSTFDLTLIDDDSQLKMLKFFNENSFSNWSLLCFRDNIDRPIWRGSLGSMNYNFDSSSRTPSIQLTAQDYFNDIDHEVPVWELGEGGDADSTSVVAYNRTESQNNLNTYYFGATALQVGNAGLGFNEVEDGAGTWESHVDSRMRLRSAHPIQIYNDEDGMGLDNTWDKWDDAIGNGYASSAAQYRTLHSRWVQDLTNSFWFKHMFGKIKETPIVSTNISGGSSFTRGATTVTLDAGGETLVNGGHIEFVDADGSVDSGVVVSASFASTHTDIQVAWLHYTRIISNSPNEVWWNTSLANGDWYKNDYVNFVQAVALVPTTLNLHKQIRNISGSDWPIFNNTWGFKRTGDTTEMINPSGALQDYDIYHLHNPADHVTINRAWKWWQLPWRSTALTYWGGSFATSRNNRDDIMEGDGIAKHYKEFVWDNIHGYRFKSVDDLAQMWAEDPFDAGTVTLTADSYLWKRKNTGGIATHSNFNTFFSIGWNTAATGANQAKAYGDALPVTNATGGNTVLTLPATNFFEKSHVAGTTVNVIEHEDDFKHCYVLWADMRNDGNANADGMFRKKNFGLMQPASQNYELSLVYADQNTDSGEERQEFVDLVLNEDVDMWEMDATADPLTGSSWGSFTGGSDYEGKSKYRNWEDKAGAFVILDTSKFFNLNTYSNGGMSGQTAGGRKEIGDYIVETEGFPILLDNYWKRACTTPETIIDHRAWTPHYRLLDNDGAGLREDIRKGDRAIQLLAPVVDIYTYQSTSLYKYNPYFPTTCKIVSQEKERVFHTNITHELIEKTGVTISAYAAGKVTIGIIGSVLGGIDVVNWLRDGHWITISGSTSTPSIDGTYRLKPSPAHNYTVDAADWSGLIELNDPTVSITTGSATVEFENTYVCNRILDLGVPNPLNKTVGGWDGSAYEGIGLTSSYLVGDGRTITMTASSNEVELNSGVYWLNFGFVKGMKIVIDNPTNPVNNGTYTITNLANNVMTLNNVPFDMSVNITTNIYSEYYNTNSAEWLINNKAPDRVNNGQSLGAYNPITGVEPYHGGSSFDIDLETYKDATLYANASVVFPMRLMLQLNGFVKNRGSMTFMEHDKFRVTYLDSLTHNWLNQSTLYGIPDLGSIPRTDRMNIEQKDALTAGRTGMITVVAAGTVAGRNKITSPTHGLVVGDVIEINSSNVLSIAYPYRQQYTVINQIDINVFEITSNNTSYEATGTGMWRKVSALDTYGHVSDARNTSIANIFSQTQQGSGVGDDVGTRTVFSYLMGRDSKPSFRPTYGSGFVFNQNNLRVSNLSTQGNEQVSNVRVFYAGDGSFVDHPQATLGTKPRWEIIQSPNIATKDEALAVAKQEYEKQRLSPLNISCEITRFDDNGTLYGDGDIMLYKARYGYITDPSRTIVAYYNDAFSGYSYDKGMWWTSLRGGNLFTGVQNAYDAAFQPAKIPTSTAANQNYHWYGANSLSYAMQVVHIPHGMPKTTDDTPATGAGFTKIKGDGCLRIAIDIAPVTSTQELNAATLNDNGNYIFRIHLLDYDFIATTTSTPAGVGLATLKSSTVTNIDSNGLYELPIPSTYWSGATGDERIVVSVNYDYLAGLIPIRMGGTNAERRLNGNSFGGVIYTSTHDDSIFPLGMRGWSDIGYWGIRKEWYAPRLHIVDDLNFTPATTLKYTDARLELSNEPMSIRSVKWSIDGRGTEKVSLELERDVSRAARGFASYILPKVNVGGKQKGKGFNANQNGNHAGNITPRAGSTAGKPKQGSRQTVYGDEVAGTTRSTPLVPMDAPPRDRRPDGTTSASSGMVFGANTLSRNLNNKIKGTMDFNNDSVLGGSFGLLGQKKPTSPPRDPHAHQSIDSFIIPEGGDAVMASNGFSLTGRAEGMITGAYGSMKVHLRVPANVSSSSVRVFGRSTLKAQATQKGILYVTCRCVETGDSVESTIQIQATTDSAEQDIVFFTGSIRGAEIAGNTIEVLFEREAGQGDDDASGGALTVHNVQIASDTRSVSGKAKSDSFSYGL